MDCEKFDQHVIDALYDELDELTYAALKRHVEGCSRCAGIWAGLRATREVGVLPLEEPPDDLEGRILEAVAVAQNKVPFHKKVLRGLAWAGSHAMRPQLAMAALFFLVIGSSLLLLRARPGSVSPMAVRERGMPAAEVAEAPAAAAPSVAVGAAAATAAPSSIVVASDGDAWGAGSPAASAPADGRLAKAEAPAAQAKADEGGATGDDARAALTAARAVRDSAGCSAAVSKLDAVALHFPGTQAASDAQWDEATCYKQMGDTQRAQQLFLALRSTGYRERAEQELAAGNSNSNIQNQVAARAAAGARAPTGAAAPAPAAPPPALADQAGGSAAGNARAAKRPAMGSPNPRAPAAPKRAVDSAAAF